VQIRENTERLLLDLQRLILLLDTSVALEEERTGVSDLANANYSATARQLRARRDNLAFTVCKLMLSSTSTIAFLNTR
jgi:hypothetical protein